MLACAGSRVAGAPTRAIRRVPPVPELLVEEVLDDVHPVEINAKHPARAAAASIFFRGARVPCVLNIESYLSIGASSLISWGLNVIDSTIETF